MATDVLMPKLSDTMEEGKILKWLKQPGDRVKAGDLLAEVETDKADMEIESFDDGVLTEVRANEGDTVPVGAVIAVLSEGGGEATATAPATKIAPPAAPATKAATLDAKPPVAATKPAAAAAKPVAAPMAAAAPQARNAGDAVRVSPLARKIAAERGVDLARVSGTGPGGRIVQKDVEAVAGGDRLAPTGAPTGRPGAASADARMELSRIRKTTAKRMAEAKREIPHFYVSADLDAEALLRLREDLVLVGGVFEGVTVTHLLVKACGIALGRVPEMNASLDGDAVIRHARVNVGIATATEQGLLVPVVPGCDMAPIATVIAAARAVVDRARRGKPGPEDLSGATFTLSNLGMFPVSHFAAVVNPPQAGILAVGTVREVPVVRAGAVGAGHLMTVTLSCDHRVVDGAIAGRFLAALKDLVEPPLALVV